MVAPISDTEKHITDASRESSLEFSTLLRFCVLSAFIECIYPLNYKWSPTPRLPNLLCPEKQDSSKSRYDLAAQLNK